MGAVVRFSLLVMVVLGGCVADADGPPIVTIETPSEVLVIAPEDEPQDADVCALAAELPLGDVCSLICDPLAMAEHMIATGTEGGQCYQLYCKLSEDAHVLVGVCLPP